VPTLPFKERKARPRISSLEISQNYRDKKKRRKRGNRTCISKAARERGTWKRSSDFDAGFKGRKGEGGKKGKTTAIVMSASRIAMR